MTNAPSNKVVPDRWPLANKAQAEYERACKTLRFAEAAYGTSSEEARIARHAVREADLAYAKAERKDLTAQLTRECR